MALNSTKTFPLFYSPGILKQSVLASSPRCPRPFATSFTFPISNTNRNKKFEVLYNGTITESDCADLCCKTLHCNLAFVEESKCYGVSFNGAKKYYVVDKKMNENMSLTLAIIDRKRGKIFLNLAKDSK
jgi:hypothetical protein